MMLHVRSNNTWTSGRLAASLYSIRTVQPHANVACTGAPSSMSTVSTSCTPLCEDTEAEKARFASASVLTSLTNWRQCSLSTIIPHRGTAHPGSLRSLKSLSTPLIYPHRTACKIIRRRSNNFGSPPSFSWSAGGIGESASGAGAKANAGSGTGRTGETALVCSSRCHTPEVWGDWCGPRVIA